MQPRDMQQDCVEDLVDASAINSQMMAESNRVETAALNLSSGLVGAKKRKAIRVIKHQMINTKLENETEERNEMNTTNGNVSLDTGVSSDLSESRPSLGSDRCGELSDAGSESGVDLCALKRETVVHSDSESRHSSDKKNNRKRLAQDDEEEDDDDEEEDEDDERHLKKRALLSDIKCPQCGDEFSCNSHLTHHLQTVHHLAEENSLSSLYRSHPLWNASSKDLADIPSILHLAQASTLLSSSKSSVHDDVKDMIQDEYKNEEDDPFSAVLREMKLKGEFPCRLCDAVFPNLRALKGHNRNHLTCAPYCCNMCPKTSNDKGALIRHMRTHNGERPYECRECQYAFTTKANCERHLRNRHGKMSREELRASIIYHLNEDSSVNKPGDELSKSVPPIFRNTMVDLTRNLLLDLQNDTGSRHSFSPRDSKMSGDRHDERHDQAMDVEDDGDDGSTDDRSDDETEQDGPLDLTVDVLDLRKRREEGNGLSLAGTKSVFVPSYFGAPYTGSSLPGLPFFYPGLSGASYTNFLESKLAEMGNPAVDLSALAVAAAHHDAIRQAQAQSKLNSSLHEGLLIPAKNLAEERKLSNSSFPVGKNEAKKLTGSAAAAVAANAACPPSAVPFGSDAVKMVLKNGVLVKKQKQRRYRTERPFGCEHCTARFTLRSNMERHIKQQHPDVWSTRPRGHRRSTCNLSMKSLPTMLDPKVKEGKTAISPEVRNAIALQLKLKRGDKSQSETGHSDEEGDGNLVIDEPKESGSSTAATGESRETADLASVSKLLNNAVAQTFQQYFQPNQEEVKASASEAGTDEPDDAECTSSDGHSGSDYGHSTEGQVMKKKSAYSNAPHRVSCPYCTRKFPWTSSLRRHILTHTGQKPYKCPQCPLWFTTKSNCDRHLLRKHGNNNDNSNSRNVPDRPFKCALCPSSTFATSDNLKKHVDNKHCPGHSSTESHGQSGSEDETAGKPSTTASPVPVDADVSCDLPFKCHLCEEGYAERADVLTHLQRQHPEEFQLIVAKRALDHSNLGHTSDEGEDYDNVRGKFPDYLNRKVTCAFCLRRFWSAEDLRRHMRTHTGERPFECDVCGRRFTLKHSMLRHKRKHEVNKNGTEESDDDDSASGSESHVTESHPAQVRMQALWNGSDVEEKKKIKMRACGSDLIGNLLGIPDTSLVEQLMSKPADDAARLLGVTGNRV